MRFGFVMIPGFLTLIAILGFIDRCICSRLRKYQRQRDRETPSLHVREPWLTLIKEGKKTVEGRKGSREKHSIWVGRRVRFYNETQEVFVQVLKVEHYVGLDPFLVCEGWERCAPHLKSFDETKKAYQQFYSDDVIKKDGGMNAIHILPLDQGR